MIWDMDGLYHIINPLRKNIYIYDGGDLIREFGPKLPDLMEPVQKIGAIKSYPLTEITYPDRKTLNCDLQNTQEDKGDIYIFMNEDITCILSRKLEWC